MWKVFIKIRQANVLIIALLLSACMSVPQKTQNSVAVVETPPGQPTVASTFKVSATIEQQFANGVAAMDAEEYQQAIEIFTQVAAKEPRASGPWINMAIAYRQLEQIDKANQAIETAVKLNPKNPFAYNQAGIIKREMGEFENAKTLYEKALAEYPDYANAHLNLAILCDLYLHKIECAKKHYQAYQKIEESDDKNVVAWLSDLDNRK